MLRLTKWYCDCVSNDGEVVIGYWARLAWGPIRIPYVAVLRRTAAGDVSEHASFRSSPEPVVEKGRIDWEARQFSVKGNWSAAVPPVSLTLLKSPDCAMEWYAVPASDAAIDISRGGRIEGLGYAERLTIAMTARHLPIDELRWGRFVSATASLSWIDWRGATPRRWAVVNGLPASDLDLGDHEVDVASACAHLELRDAVTLRDAPVFAGFLLGAPALLRWMLRGLARAHEVKWRSAGTLTVAGQTHHGWAIHEIVRFR